MCLCTVGGVLTAESMARVWDQLLIGQQNGLLSAIVNFFGGAIQNVLNFLLPWLNKPVNDQGTCTNTIPSNGYPKCPAANSPPGQCTFGCNNGYKVCGDACLPNSATCPSTLAKRSQRINICPQGYRSCPVHVGKKVYYECIATETDLWSCGGCPEYDDAGVDCSTLPGVNDVSVSFFVSFCQDEVSALRRVVSDSLFFLFSS